jgi:predicted aspartyl protease
MTFVLLVAASCCFAAGQSKSDQGNTDQKILFDSHRWFELRDAIAVKSDSPLYRGAVAAAFNDSDQAEKIFSSVINAAPKSDEADQARACLALLYYRMGRYKRALALTDERLAVHADNEEAQGYRQLYASFGRYPEQMVTKHSFSKLKFHMDAGGMFIPVSVNGKPANYLVDSGADISVVNESEAKRVGMVVHDSEAKLSGISGAQTGFRTAVADDFIVGNIHLKNVVFYVFPDGQPPFADLPADEQGILGSVVLQALETIRWKTDGTFEARFPSKAGDIRESNMCFNGTDPITRAEFQQHKLDMMLDTGSIETQFWPKFAAAFSKWLHEVATEGSTPLLGFGGSRNVHSVSFAEATLHVANYDLTVRPAKVLLEHTSDASQYYEGSLGMDLLKKAHQVTVDYKAMKLSLE